MASGSNPENETYEEKLARRKKECDYLCESENNKRGNLDEIYGFDCPKCKNKGFIYVPELYLDHYSPKYVTCDCAKARQTIGALTRSGLGSVVHDYTFANYMVSEPWQRSVVDKAMSYLDSENANWFFFGGTSGCGKTHICTAITVSLIKRGKEAKYMLWRDEASRLKAMINDGDYAEEMRKYKTIDVLYIDDLFKTGKTEMQGKQRPTQADINLAFEILNSRAMQKKITIISSESTLLDLIDIDEAIGGRIKKECGDYCLNIAPDRSKNYRLK